MTNKINDINQVFKGKKLLAYDETTGEFAIVSPHIFTSTVYTEDGVPLDEYLTFKPQELIDKLDDILKDAPKEYDTFREIAAELNTNKDSIVEILRAISNRVKMPASGETGQVLKLNSDGQVVFADDKDTVYTHPKTHKAGIIETDPSHRFVTDKEKETWDKKLDAKSDISTNIVRYANYQYTNDENGKKEKITFDFRDVLRSVLSQHSREIYQLRKATRCSDLVATLDGNKKIPLDQLPDEAIREYDLSSFLTAMDLEGILRGYRKADGTTVTEFRTEGKKDADAIRQEWFYAHYDSPNTPDKKKAWFINTMVFERNILQVAYDSSDNKLTYFRKKSVGSSWLPWQPILTGSHLEKLATKKDLEAKESTIHKGEVNGYAALDDKGKVPEEQLPEKALREYDLTPYAKSEDIQKTYATKQEVSSGKLDYTPENAENRGKANGYASLGGDGKVPADQLPSYVDDVLEFASKTNFPSSGEKGKIYVDLSTENIFRWSGSAYVEISPSLITQADIKKLQGIEDGAEKNNVTQTMINTWNNKISSSDVGNVKFSPANVTKWSTSSSRELKWWISDLILRTVELRDELKKKPDVVEMSLADYNNLTTKKPNTIYAID